MKSASLVPFFPLLLLAACGRAEPVENMPSQDELAAAANAAAAHALAAAKTDEVVDSRNYVNLGHGFSVTLPEGWAKDARSSTDAGVVFQDPGAGADVRVFWQANDNDKTLQEIVEAVSSGSDTVDGDFVGTNEYRGTANDGEGNNVAVRLLRQADGSIVTATFVYPEMLSEQYRSIAQKVLDSLRVFAPKGEATADGPDGNAAAPAKAD